MAAIELSNGQEIERSGEKSNPSGAADGRQQESAGRGARMQDHLEKAQEQRSAKDDLGVCGAGESGDVLGVEHAVDKCRYSENETDERARGADIKQRTVGADRRTNQDKCAKGANQRGKRNEKRIAGADVMMAAGEEVAEFVCEKDGKQSEGERQARGKAGGLFVQQREGSQQFVEGDGLVLCVCDGELSAGHEACAESEKK